MNYDPPITFCEDVREFSHCNRTGRNIPEHFFKNARKAPDLRHSYICEVPHGIKEDCISVSESDFPKYLLHHPDERANLLTLPYYHEQPNGDWGIPWEPEQRRRVGF